MLDLLDVNTVLVGLALLLCIWWYYSTKLPTGFPPGPRSIPILGSLLSLNKHPKKPHLGMLELSEKYGPVLGMQMGSYPAVVLNNMDVIKEALVKSGDAFTWRPQFMEELSDLFRRDGHIEGIVWTTGEKSKSNRRLLINGLRKFGLGNKTFEQKIQEEAIAMCQEIMKYSDEPYNIHMLFQEAASNIMRSICFGDRLEYSDPKFQKLMKCLRSSLASNAAFSILNFMPWIRKIYTSKSHKQLMSDVNAVDELILEQIESHRQTFDPNEIRDFTDLYLSNEKDINNDICGGHLCKCLADVFVGGSETTATSMRWIILYMVSFPDVQKKCQLEIDDVIGSSRQPELQDREKMPYIESMIHETLRLGNIIPLSLCSTKRDITFGGYQIPRDTIVFNNLYAANMDSTYWTNPEEYHPERWLGTDGTFQKNEMSIPFSTGIRMCPGDGLAKMNIFLLSTSLMQKFTFRMADPNNPPILAARPGLHFGPWPFEAFAEAR